MQLNEIYGNLRNNQEPNLRYYGEIDPEIPNIEGRPYTMYVNEADTKYQHGITFAVSSDEDDGVVWDVDLGTPVPASVGQYVDEPDTGTSGWDDVSWKRDEERNPVVVEVESANPVLRNSAEVIKQRLGKLNPSDLSQFESQVHNIFVELLDNLNNS